MIDLGTFSLQGYVVNIRSSEPLAEHLLVALAALACERNSNAKTLRMKRFRDGTWSVSWPDEQRYEGPDTGLALYDAFGALNEVAAQQAADQGRIGLHGGSIRIDGQGVAIVGHSGAGKSTLTAGLVQAGYGYIADELSAVELGGDDRCEGATHSDVAARPMLHPYHRPIGMRVGGAAAIGVDIPDGPFSHTFPLPATTIGTLVGPSPLHLIAFVDRHHDMPSEISGVTPAQSLQRLANHTLGTWGLEAEIFTKLDRLVRQVPSVVVRYGTVAEGVATIERALAESES